MRSVIPACLIYAGSLAMSYGLIGPDRGLPPTHASANVSDPGQADAARSDWRMSLGPVLMPNAPNRVSASTPEPQRRQDTSAASNGTGDQNQREAADDLTDEQRNQLAIARGVLLNPSDAIDLTTRRATAKSVLAIRAAPALDLLRQALASGNARIVVAVLDALLSEPRAVPELLDDCVGALATAPVEVRLPLADVLRRYGPVAVKPIGEIAANTELDDLHRISAINALGGIHTQPAAGELIGLINDGNDASSQTPSDVIVEAVCRALERLTGLSHGVNVDAWLTWWSSARSYGEEQWDKITLDQVAGRLAALERQLEAQRDANAATEQRLIEAHREILRTLPNNDAQFERIAQLLTDASPGIRLVAIERVEKLLRDDVRMPESMHKALAAATLDVDARVRLQAVQVVDDLSLANVVAVLTTCLASESDPTIRLAITEMLAKRSMVDTIDPLLSLLADSTLCSVAAEGLWKTLTGLDRADPAHEQIILTARTSIDEAAASTSHCPGVIRLWALLTDEARLGEVVAMLDEPNETADRSAAAEGLAYRGHRPPLVARAGDAAIFPHAVEVMARGEADIANLRTLAAFVVPDDEAFRSILGAGLVRLAARVDDTQLVLVDDILADSSVVTSQQRIAVLARVSQIAVQPETVDLRVTITMRLAKLYLEANEPRLAHTALSRLNGIAAVDGLKTLRFTAAIRAGEFEAAAKHGPDLAGWIVELERLEPAAGDADATKALLAEIDRRFADALTTDQDAKARVDGVRQKVAGLSGGGDDGDGDGPSGTSGVKGIDARSRTDVSRSSDRWSPDACISTADGRSLKRGGEHWH